MFPFLFLYLQLLTSRHGPTYLWNGTKTPTPAMFSINCFVLFIVLMIIIRLCIQNGNESTVISRSRLTLSIVLLIRIESKCVFRLARCWSYPAPTFVAGFGKFVCPPGFGMYIERVDYDFVGNQSSLNCYSP